MKIETACDSSSIALGDVPMGEAFWFEGDLFIKVDRVEFEKYPKQRAAANLRTGKLDTFDVHQPVELAQATVVTS